MDTLMAQMQRVWPKANWAISRSDGVFVALVANGPVMGRGESRQSPQDALDRAIRGALHDDYEKEFRLLATAASVEAAAE
jgi:hypothetical protein